MLFCWQRIKLGDLFWNVAKFLLSLSQTLTESFQLVIYGQMSIGPSWQNQWSRLKLTLKPGRLVTWGLLQIRFPNSYSFSLKHGPSPSNVKSFLHGNMAGWWHGGSCRYNECAECHFNRWFTLTIYMISSLQSIWSHMQLHTFIIISIMIPGTVGTENTAARGNNASDSWEMPTG